MCLQILLLVEADRTSCLLAESCLGCKGGRTSPADLHQHTRSLPRCMGTDRPECIQLEFGLHVHFALFPLIMEKDRASRADVLHRMVR